MRRPGVLDLTSPGPLPKADHVLAVHFLPGWCSCHEITSTAGFAVWGHGPAMQETTFRGRHNDAGLSTDLIPLPLAIAQLQLGNPQVPWYP